jgi:large repetitive protein
LGEWFRFWDDVGGETRYIPVTNRSVLGPKYRTVVINLDAPGTAAYLDTAAHEGFHALVGRHLPSVVDAGDLAIGRIPIGAPVKYLEEAFAYGIGHLAAGRLHGTVVAPIEVFLSGSLTRGEKVVTIIVGGTAAGGYVVYELLDGD